MAASLRGQTALITGAAKRIGRATALALAEAGAHIVVHYHTAQAEADVLAEALRGLGVQAWTISADLAQPAEAAALIERAFSLAGQVDILVNNASIFPTGTLANISFADLQQNVAVNAWSPFVLSRAFAGRVTQGKIINLLDTRITGYDWTHVGYILSKHLLAVLTRMQALEYAPRLTVNAVAPGLILPPPGQSEDYLQKLIHTVPLGMHGEAEDIAEAILFLLQSDFITGQVLYVDGGRHLKEGFGG